MKNPQKTQARAPEKRGGRWSGASLGDVAQFFGVSETTIRKDWTARGMPGTRGAYSLDEIARWRIDYERQRSGGDAAGGAARSAVKDAQAAERLKRERIETRREQLKLRREEGELIERAGIELYIATFNTRFGDWCDQLPDVITAGLPPKWRTWVRTRLKKEFDERRVAIRNELEAKARELDRQTDVESAEVIS